MFEEGDLLFFRPFIFEDGSCKNKFFVVLRNCGGACLLAALPTSKDHLPADLDVHAGCYEYPERMVNVYVFMANTPIAANAVTGKPFSFDKNTFIYGANLQTYPVSSFILQQDRGETQIEQIGKLEPDVYDDLVRCLKGSIVVKNKFKKIL